MARLRPDEVWSADFETTTEASYKEYGYVRVWLWGLVRCDGGMELHGNDIGSFFEEVKLWRCKRVFFYNLRFSTGPSWWIGSSVKDTNTGNIGTQ